MTPPRGARAHARARGRWPRAAGTIADPQVRNRGTIGGSLAHGDPGVRPAGGAADRRGLGDRRRAPAGERTIAAADLFQDYLETAIGPDEVLTEVRVPALDGYGFGYEKFNRRSEDWAMVAVERGRQATATTARTSASG